MAGGNEKDVFYSFFFKSKCYNGNSNKLEYVYVLKGRQHIDVCSLRGWSGFLPGKYKIVYNSRSWTP